MDNTDAMITYNKYVFLVKLVDEGKKIVKADFFYDRGEVHGGLLKGTKIGIALPLLKKHFQTVLCPGT